MTLKEYLAHSGMTSSQVARALGVSPQYASRLKDGLRTPSMALARKIEHLTEGQVRMQEMLPNDS